jgi:hypothetical protein
LDGLIDAAEIGTIQEYVVDARRATVGVIKPSYRTIRRYLGISCTCESRDNWLAQAYGQAT